MKSKINALWNVNKKRLISLAGCAALMLSMGATAVFAEDASLRSNLILMDEEGRASYSADGGETWTEGMPEGFFIQAPEFGTRLSWTGDSSVLVPVSGAVIFGTKQEDGKTLYTTDGETWTETAPEGFTMNSVGSVAIQSINGTFSVNGMLLRAEDGKLSYSSDGGATWTEGIPEGVFTGILMVRMEDGKSSHSADGGVTWIEGMPEGFFTQTLRPGMFLAQDGDFDMPVSASGIGIFGMVREDGITLYSTDGENWSETAPGGFSTNADGSVMFSLQ